MVIIEDSPITSRGCNKYLPELRKLARNNRNNPTKTELRLWYMVLSKNKMKYKFLRQKPIDRFILDFYCPKLLLAIEVDGESHSDKYHYDKGRDQLLQRIGIKTIRVRSENIIREIESTRKMIQKEILIRENEI